MEEVDGVTVRACVRCPELVESRTQIVNGTGPEDARVLFVGEAPGAREDELGEPFVGRSGDILNEVLLEHGLDRDSVRITNCVRCRPPNNRDPRSEERSNCRGYLDAEIESVDPAVIVTLGKVPGELLLGRSIAVTKLAGTVEDVQIAGQSRRVLVCLHPAATLYDRSQRGTFEAAIEEAAAIAGVGDGRPDGSGQARIGEY